MAHIVDGVLSTEVTVACTVAATAGVAYALKTMNQEDIPKIALMSAAFLVLSTLRVPLPGTSAHLLLAGLMGLTIGWQVFPAVLVALVLQLAFFGFGGLTALGPNVLNIALPAVLTAYVLKPLLRDDGTTLNYASIGFGAGALGVALIGLSVAGTLALSGQEFVATAKLVLASHSVVMIVEGLVTASAFVLMMRIRPDMLRVTPG